jgi:hypothetical protein
LQQLPSTPGSVAYRIHLRHTLGPGSEQIEAPENQEHVRHKIYFSHLKAAREVTACFWVRDFLSAYLAEFTRWQFWRRCYV